MATLLANLLRDAEIQKLKLHGLADMVICNMQKVNGPCAGNVALTRWRWVAAVFFALAGVNHFLKPHFYEEIVPPGFPSPKILVMVSGLAEIAGGVGLVVRPARRLAGWGLIALLLAVYPANIYMAAHPERFGVPAWILWARLPLQVVFLVWVWLVGLGRSAKNKMSSGTRP